jgi:cytoskeleton protein RodZ
MIEEAMLLPEVVTLAESVEPITAGSLLKAAREREGLHIAALAVSMKVPVKKLEALEADRFDLLPDAVFVRALASSVCRSLKLDAGPVLALLPASAPPRLNTDDRGINTPFNSPGQTNNASLTGHLMKPAVLMVMLLLAAALVVHFYPEASRDLTGGDSAHVAVPVMPPEIASEPVEIPVPGKTVGSNESLVIEPASPSASPASAVVLNVASQASENSKRSSLSEIANPIAAASSPVVGAVLQLKAKGLAWVQVTDAKGAQLLSRTLQPTEVIGVAGALPLSVIIGRADLISVELRGKPFDLSAISQNNVARFEVKP